MIRLLSIAGSDSGGGAGIQQDVRVFTCLGAYSSTVITSVTAQNTLGISNVLDIPGDLVISQLEAVINDIRPHGIKIGMLGGHAPVEEISSLLKGWKESQGGWLVVDPIILAKDGTCLCDQTVLDLVKIHLFPLADIICPNFNEFMSLTDRKLSGLDDLIAEGEGTLKILNAQNILVKGGHIPDALGTDVLIGRDGVRTFPSDPIKCDSTHGTGCVYSSALLFYLASGLSITEAVKSAKSFIELALRCPDSIGKGVGPVNVLAFQELQRARYTVLAGLESAWDKLQSRDCASLVPEVQMNICYALPCAQSESDCAAFPGRIVRYKNGVARVSGPVFGGSSHMARIVLTVMRSDPSIRCAINVCYNPTFIKRAEQLGMKIGAFSRSSEPAEIKEKEGSTLVWGVARVIEDLGYVPDLIYDLGDVGKEPMIRILATDPLSAVDKALAIGDIR